MLLQGWHLNSMKCLVVLDLGTQPWLLPVFLAFVALLGWCLQQFAQLILIYLLFEMRIL